MIKKSSRPRGRPRTFDRDQVLDRAVTTFWTKGYDGTSLDDLTKSMGINRPSLYASFGNKHGLYLEVINRYAGTLGCQPVKEFDGEPDIKKAVSAFLETAIRCVTTKNAPKGCLCANVAANDAENDELVRTLLSEMFAETDQVIAEFFLAAQAKGQLSKGSDPYAMARLTVSITHSFAIRARVGASRDELSQLARDFLAVLLPS